jgi:hypothetical protein
MNPEILAALIAKGFKAQSPKTTGLYQFACGETDGAAEYAAVVEAPAGFLVVCEDGLGRTILPHFHDGLTACHWKKIA